MTMTETIIRVQATTALTAIYTAPGDVLYAKVDVLRAVNSAASADALVDVQTRNAAGSETAYLARNYPISAEGPRNVLESGSDHFKLKPSEPILVRGSEAGLDIHLQVTEVRNG